MGRGRVESLSSLLSSCFTRQSSLARPFLLLTKDCIGGGCRKWFSLIDYSQTVFLEFFHCMQTTLINGSDVHPPLWFYNKPWLPRSHCNGMFGRVCR